MSSVDDQLAAIAVMPSKELKEEWCRFTATPLPRVSPSLLRLALSWEIQAKAYGGLSRATRQTLDQMAAGRTRTSSTQPGMRLVREWNGAVHVVTIGEDKVIRWNNRDWNSLSGCCQSNANRSPRDAVRSLSAVA